MLSVMVAVTTRPSLPPEAAAAPATAVAPAPDGPLAMAPEIAISPTAGRPAGTISPLAIGAAVTGNAITSDPVAIGPATTDSTPVPPPATTTTAPTTTTPPPPPRSFTLAFTGDVLLHSRVSRVAATHAAGAADRDYDYRPLLTSIRSQVEEADRAICHLEVNLSADGTRLSSYPSFRAPGQIAADLADLGYDSCTLASNHILDKGVAGVAETLGVLDEARIHAIGAARSPAEAEQQRLFTVRDVTVAHLAYTYWFNGIPLPADAPWTSNQIDQDRILADAAQARRDGAEYIVVSLHWGEQYQHQPNQQQRELGPRLLASPNIDLIVGHHAHVVQPIERINGKWLVYGLGNLLSNSSQVRRRDELLITVTVTERPDDGFTAFTTDLTVTPLHLDHATLTVHPTNPARRPATIGPNLAAALDASWNRVFAVLSPDGQPLDFELH
jgi:poly-gamma-glutamate synthesis protein (capsule biosynthesis protein)